MTKHLLYGLGLCILIGLTGCGKEEQVIPDLLEPVGVQIDVAEAQISEIYNQYTYRGELVPYIEDLKFFRDGILKEIKVTVGDEVKQGQILATISDEETIEQIEILEKEIDRIITLGEFSDIQASKDIEVMQITLDNMLAEGVSGRNYQFQEIELQKLQLELKQNQEVRQLKLQELQEKRSLLQSRINHNQVIAPCDGKVVYVSQHKKGDSVEGDRTIICVADATRMRIRADYETEVLVENSDECYAMINGKQYPVTYIPYEMSEYMEMVLYDDEMKVYYTIDAMDEDLEIGQYAVVMIRNGYKDGTLTIPVNALYSDASGSYVYKVTDEKRIRCDVTVGMKNDVRVEILDGLEEGDMVYVME